MSSETDQPTPAEQERRAVEHLSYAQRALLEQFPDAAKLQFTATEDGKFVVVAGLLDSDGQVLTDAPGTVMVLSDAVVGEDGETRDVTVFVEDLLPRALLIYPYPISAIPGVVLEDGQQGLYSLDLTDR